MKDKDTKLEKITIPTDTNEEINKQDLIQLFKAIEKLNNNIDVLNKMMARTNAATRQFRDEHQRPPKIIHWYSKIIIRIINKGLVMLGFKKQLACTDDNTSTRPTDSEPLPSLCSKIEKLSAFNQLNHVALDTKQLIRSLRYVRDDLKILHPKLNLPSGRIIRCLVQSALHSGAPVEGTRNYNEQLIALLQHILHRCEIEYSIRHCFKDLDGVTPLFPNNELYGPQHVRHFATRALTHLGAV